MAEFLKGLASLAWPAVTAWFLYTFKGPIEDLIGRIVKIGKDGLELSAQEAIVNQLAPAPQPNGAIQPIGQGQVEAADERPFIQAQIALFERQLAEMNLQAAQRVRLLLVRLAEAQVGINLLRAHINMFGTQRAALEAMLVANTPIDLRPFYEQHMARYRAIQARLDTPPFSFEVWCHHLTLNGLVALGGNLAELTELGRTFLQLTRGLPVYEGL